MSPVEDVEPLAFTEPPPLPLGEQAERARRALRNRRLVWRVIANLVTVAILVACFLPDPGLAPSNEFPWDKVAHALAFAAFAFCWRGAGLAPFFVLAAGVVLTSATEIGQGLFLPERTAGWGDVAADVAADVAGLATGLLLNRLTGARTLAPPLPPAT
jgi:hypothetical protein